MEQLVSGRKIVENAVEPKVLEEAKETFGRIGDHRQTIQDDADHGQQVEKTVQIDA